MALIKCQECGKEISDQSDKCIHCGFPIKSISNVQQVEIAGINVQPTRKAKRYVISALILLILGSALFFLQTQHKRFEMEKAIADNMLDIHGVYIISAALHSTTYQVWSEAISDGRDFNNALSKFSSNKDIIDIKTKIAAQLTAIEKVYLDVLKNESAYPELSADFANVYLKLKDAADLAISPKGNLRSYGEETRQRNNEVDRALQKLKLKLTTSPDQGFAEWLKAKYL